MKRSGSVRLTTLAVLVYLGGLAGAARAADDATSTKLVDYYRRKTNVPPSANVEVKSMKDSPIAGTKSGTLSAAGHEVTFLVSDDGHYAIFGDEAKDFKPSELKGAKSTTATIAGRPTKVTISDDASYAIFGDIDDLTIDPFSALMEKIDITRKPAKGPLTAKVTIVEYSDYQCSFCAKGYQTLENQVLKEYGDRVRFIYKNFPLAIHPWAGLAAIASECTLEQKNTDAYWTLYNFYFENQKDITAQNLKEKSLEALRDTKIDAAQFSDCLDNKKTEDTVKKEMAEGSNVGVSGTPAFFINGRFINGALPFDYFKAIIDDELARAEKK